MHSREGLANANDIQPAYAKAVGIDERERRCREQIRQTAAEVQALLHQCCLLLEVRTYQREQAKLMLIQAWEAEDDLGIVALETSHKVLMNQRNQLIETLQVSFGN